MWLSLSWLGDFIDLGDRSAEQVAEDLTMRTALIEAVERRGELDDKVVVGRVLERGQHPNADRLSLCQIDVGGETLEIVCGAPNVAAGQAVPVARIGSRLPNGLKLKKTKIRGVVSQGMICSEVELSLGEDQDGIMVLEEGLEIGRPFREVPGVADTLLEIDNKSITHRPDLWGHEGFARELAAIYRLDLRSPRLDTDLLEGADSLRIEIEDAEACRRYDALFLRGPLGGAAPGWIRRRLTHCGLRPLSLAVDLSNYVMLELGQPTHPFDASRIEGGVIRIRQARAGEDLVTLDGERRTLPDGTLVIADESRPLAIAGIIGGQESGIQDDTAVGVLESASFDPISVRATSTELGLRTDALSRFEKALDPGLAERALRRYAALMRQVAPEIEIDPQFAAAGSFEYPALELRFRTARACAKLGVTLSREEMSEILERLGFAVSKTGDDLDVRVPSWRATRDVDCEDDLIEEVGRVHGYEKIPAELPVVACAPVALEPFNRAWRQCVEALTWRFGFAETMSYPYLEESVAERAGMGDDQPCLQLQNPLQKSAGKLRRSQIPWLLEFVDRNIKTNEEVRLFECGRVFLPREGSADLPYEPLTLSAALAERVTRKGEGGRLLRRLKGVLEALGVVLERPLRFEATDAACPRWLHPVRSAAVHSGGRCVGFLGQVHPDVVTGFGWSGDVAAFEIDLSAIMDDAAAPRGYVPPPKFPPMRVDLSFVLPYTLAYESLDAGLRKVGSILSDVELVDEYASADMAAGQRSLTLRLSFRASDRTLTDEDVNGELESIRAWLLEQGVTFRGDS